MWKGGNGGFQKRCEKEIYTVISSEVSSVLIGKNVTLEKFALSNEKELFWTGENKAKTLVGRRCFASLRRARIKNALVWYGILILKQLYFVLHQYQINGL